MVWRRAPSRASPLPHLDLCTFVESVSAAEKTLGRQGLFLPADQLSRCLEMIREISTIEVFPVNSNFTFPSDEK